MTRTDYLTRLVRSVKRAEHGEFIDIRVGPHNELHFGASHEMTKPERKRLRRAKRREAERGIRELLT